MYLLDTNTCIRYLNGTSESVKEQIESKGPGDICVCSVVKAELFYGAFKSHHPNRNLIRQNQFLNRFVSLSFDDRASMAYGQIRATLELSGCPIGPNDLLIAAIAIANSVTLVTNNTREFGRINQLHLDDWISIAPA
jgi:tRNA(fMet)-specific endonuclease VapC